MPCEICGGVTRRVFGKYGHDILGCACGHRFVALAADERHVARVYADSYFTEGGQGYPDYLGLSRIVTAQGRHYARLLARFMPPGELLDVGAAAGFILRGFIEEGWRGIGLEPNARMSALARESGLDVRTGSLESFRDGRSFDLVSMIQVIAHFHDLRAAFASARELTRPGGYWLIETWNRESRFARLQGRHWHEYCPPSSLHYFSPGSLAALADQHGFDRVAQGRPPKKLNLRHAGAFASHALLGHSLNWLPDWTVPYASFDLMWALFRRRT
jgi:SAM-dependent methyltransferase